MARDLASVAIGILACTTLCAPNKWIEAASTSAESVRTIPSRTLPPPTTVSTQLRELLKRDYNNGPVPETIEDWRQWAQQADQTLVRQLLVEFSNRFNVTVAARVFGGVPCYEVAPKKFVHRNRNRLLVDLHPGGWFTKGEAAALSAVILSGLTGIKVIAVDYRTLPDHPYPAALNDSIAVWRDLTKLVEPRNIGLSGSSAGGGMALSLVQRAIAEGFPVPGAVLSDSPVSDLSKTGDSYYSNEGVDNRAPKYDGLLEGIARLYANGRKLDDPAISPVYGDFKGFPPTFLVSGTRDLFLSNTVRVQSKLLEADVPTQLVVGEALTHGIIQEAVICDVPEGLLIYSFIAKFFDAYLGT